MSVTSVAEIKSYHAHIYFRDARQRLAADELRQQIAARFAVQMGRWHETPIGPHQYPMYQVAFNPDIFPLLVPWLMLHRRGLTILLHPNTNNARRDHLDHPFWFGDILAIVRPDLLPEQNEAAPVVADQPR